ncbi:MAG: DUF1643 domain-containing protein, partial [Bdellovibrionales bacterium]|nr:DUF1643 domain-containing protein [Bdellovibrionales bacterium]
RIWGSGELLLFIMLNPSTADASLNDPTIRRCMRFAEGFGYSGLMVVNLFTRRTPSPKALSESAEKIGSDWERHFRAALMRCAKVVAAWGASPLAGDSPAYNLAMRLNFLYCLGTTKEGHPRHPLYVPGNQGLIEYGLEKMRRKV